MRRRYQKSFLCGMVIAGLAAGPASAQYTIDINEATDPNYVRYFGSAKDERGRLLGDVTFTVQSGQANFIFITDKDGRFRGSIPRIVSTATIRPKCIRSGFRTIRLDKRPGPKGAREVVQLDCVLKRLSQ